MTASPAATALTVDGDWYRLVVPAGQGVAWLDDRDGTHWAQLRLLSSVDTLDGPDETLEVPEPHVEEGRDGTRLTWHLRSSRWQAHRLVLVAAPDTITVTTEVEGRGRLTDVSLLGGRAILARTNGWLFSGAWFETFFCASPTDPARIARPPSESTVIGVVSGSEPGRGNWFFTPAPFSYAATRSALRDPVILPPGPWLTVDLDAVPGESGFNGFGYRAVDRGFLLSLDYDGKTTVDGAWRSPPLVLGRADDPYAGIAAQRDRLGAAGVVARPGRARSSAADWWRQPIFCGWGAQGAMARADGRPLSAAKEYATQDNYDRFLAVLEARGVVPGTVVVDDKWQAGYGTCRPDTGRWPDLRAWIEDRHRRGQRVLLWYKAWDPEGLPAEWCVRSAAGTPLGIDPTHPHGAAAIRDAIRTMLAPDGLAADGLKIDFTARTPSGVATTHHGPAWGVDLLRVLLETIADEARSVRPDALLVAHAPNAVVATAVDMLRLNDTLRLDDPRPIVDIVPQMRYRAAVVRAACPDHLIDTDDWCAPGLDGWRAYTRAKVGLGVPALYYASHLDLTGEALEDSDYALLRETWTAYRTAEGLSAIGVH